MARNKLYTERVEVCLTKKQKEQLNREAEKNQIRVNQLIREIIQAYLG